MDNSHLLMIAMAEKCKRLIRQCEQPDVLLPVPLQPGHLQWMCDQIVEHAEIGPPTKLHRWIGFVQCGMLAQRILDLDRLKSMFDELKRAHGEAIVDVEDLLDHLDPQSSFEFDIGGQG
ncbi:MAG: hypothetical protein KDB27_04545 [Planctomycetales bacterium]|nr:hypothetical protein [Planctomycetales bacterium]